MSTVLIEQAIIDAEIKHNIDFPINYSTSNYKHILKFIKSFPEIDLSSLEKLVYDSFDELAGSRITKEEYKHVFDLLKDRKLHPKGTFDKRGRFYLDDDELVDVRTPSAAYPYSQMAAGRTLKFVKAIAKKYRCKNVEEIISHFKKDKTFRG